MRIASWNNSIVGDYEERVMKNRYFAAIVLSLAAVSTANAQVKRGVMRVTGGYMH